jgi:hypothetical protein
MAKVLGQTLDNLTQRVSKLKAVSWATFTLPLNKNDSSEVYKGYRGLLLILVLDP